MSITDKDVMAFGAWKGAMRRKGSPESELTIDAWKEFGPMPVATHLIDDALAALADAGRVIIKEDRRQLAKGREHLTEDGTIQSDKYPGCPAGKVPLSVTDPLAQDLLWEYARRHAAARLHGDSEFPRDLREALLNTGFTPDAGRVIVDRRTIKRLIDCGSDLTKTKRSDVVREWSRTAGEVRAMIAAGGDDD